MGKRATSGVETTAVCPSVCFVCPLEPQRIPRCALVSSSDVQALVRMRMVRIKPASSPLQRRDILFNVNVLPLGQQTVVSSKVELRMTVTSKTPFVSVHVSKSSGLTAGGATVTQSMGVSALPGGSIHVFLRGNPGCESGNTRGLLFETFCWEKRIFFNPTQQRGLQFFKMHWNVSGVKAQISFHVISSLLFLGGEQFVFSDRFPVVVKSSLFVVRPLALAVRGVGRWGLDIGLGQSCWLLKKALAWPQVGFTHRGQRRVSCLEQGSSDFR